MKQGLRLDRSRHRRLEVVVAGGVLRRWSVAVTLLAPESDFTYRPPAAGERYQRP